MKSSKRKRSICRLVITIGLVCSLHCTSTRSTVVPERLALTILGQYDAAWLRKDAAAFSALLSPTYVYFTSTGRVMDRAAILAMLGSDEYNIGSGSRTELQAYAFGRLVVVSSRWKGTGSYAGKSFVDDQRCSLIVAVASKPVVLAEHCTNLKNGR